MRLRLDPTVARFRSPILTAEVAERLQRNGWSVRVVDMAEVPDKAGILAAFGHGLACPDWVGSDWDALADVLGDGSWWEPGRRGRAIIVARAARLGEQAVPHWSMVLAILRSATERWAETETPMGVLIRGRAIGPASGIRSAAKRHRPAKTEPPADPG